MKKNKSDLGIKNTILIIVSALSLAFATLAWFSLNHHNQIDTIQAEVGSLSSNFVFYRAVDENRNGTIDGNEEYVEIEDDAINTRYMVPGETFFYKAVLSNTVNNANFAFLFNNIICNYADFASKIIVSAKLVRTSDNQTVTQTQLTPPKSISEYPDNTDDNGQTDATILTASNLAKGQYEIYYTLKISETTTSDFEDVNLTISDILPTFYL